ncbi:alpha/beta fold hydrolase BchO [Lentisalinibacter salinarum]|uniref:alpha/beta fold hydrolase BchO n=1 Tax=Lentisalinibacter salinarum TaxID=2992239 RepID=UPI00386E495F
MRRPDGGAAVSGRGLALAGRDDDKARTGETLQWDIDGRDWPNRQTSHFAEAGGIRWHFQRAGDGPVALLLHGTGASAHSWRDLLPELAREFTVVAPDLPGHGFTTAAADDGYSLPGMAGAVASLLASLDVSPRLVVGHSAGAAIALRMVLDGRIHPDAVVSINGALLPFRGLPGQLFSPAARLLARLAFVPRLVARRAADPDAVTRLLRDTGSRVDDEGVALYRRLISSPAHVAATIAMMSRWDLAPMIREYPELAVPLLLVVGEQDGTVAPHEAERVARLVPGARVERLAGLGHLAHEEEPERVAELIIGFARSVEAGGAGR